MKRTILYVLGLTACLLPPTRMSAQYINAYVDAGGITSQIEGDELKGFKHWGFTGGVGALVRFDAHGRWAVSIETGYSSRGVHNNLHNMDNLYNIDLTMHYVDIPVTLFFKDPYGGIRVGAGLMYSRLVQQPHGQIQCRPSFFHPDTDDMTFLKNDLALMGELRFGLWRNLQLSLRYQYSLFPVKKQWHFTEDEGKATERSWANDCFNQSITCRLIWQFGEQERPERQKASNKKKTRRR